MSLECPIILLGGPSGSAKSSTARKVCSELELAHRMGSGFIREICRTFLSQEVEPELHNYSFQITTDVKTPFENLYRQSYAMAEAVNKCIERAHYEGTSLIIEGVNIIPGLHNMEYVDFAGVLSVENYDRHFEMIHGKTHANRVVSKENFDINREIQEEFKNRAKEHNWHILDVTSDTNISEYIKKAIREKHENLL